MVGIARDAVTRGAIQIARLRLAVDPQFRPSSAQSPRPGDAPVSSEFDPGGAPAQPAAGLSGKRQWGRQWFKTAQVVVVVEESGERQGEGGVDLDAVPEFVGN